MKQIESSLYQIYKEMLSNYLESKNEHTLYSAQQFSKEMIEQDMSPEDMISLHLSVFREIIQYVPDDVEDSFDVLLEVMVGYGLAHREHQSLRDRQRELESELNVAAQMQQSLLPSDPPSNENGVELGLISVPAGKMSGDYYHYMTDDHGRLGVAVADVIGKGVPAALCMSMIKYAIDSLPEQRLQPGPLLENVNRVVEQNIDNHMFITMVYGFYDPDVHQFHYAGAGHEPGFFYRAKTDTFEDLKTKGLVLGLSKKTSYNEYVAEVELNDMIVLLSDGVTECRYGNDFIERDQITALIRKYSHLTAQEIVENVYRDLERLQSFQLRDDFTLLILRRNM
ncbi:PP2C family protein-serine/threonine phosphatase [Texcoconibacillus texcoconensis]|uniref:Sigma-B regulation protein RsbU (Phosphoserine phosphatase) n=1 Tax=Texcoconibacillus texcoconensis TaxID=1095777 RepID=A0A840QSA3_9BACI|nr:PP2C family protein-serine/threonine phosphatase [Texcoconibacillus texcoconensis]MBB5174209.1 sigma-B regulation protein RsbU (phosphoserine phosphatase) [Texcoconibacillus texcoconensis]